MFEEKLVEMWFGMGNEFKIFTSIRVGLLQPFLTQIYTVYAFGTRIFHNPKKNPERTQ